MATSLRSISSLLFFFFILHLTAVSGQSPAPAPAPSGPTNITSVLEKGGQFTMFIKLLKSTQEADQIDNQLNTSSSGQSQGLTVFAPPDNAFSNLKSGTLNSLSDQQKVQLVQFHVLPQVLTTSQFQTVSNPLRTQAGDGQNGQFPFNITSAGNSVNITTGVVNATVANTIYTDKQLAVYQVDQVLLPLALFGSPDSTAPTPAPGLDNSGSVSKGAAGDDSDSTDTSGAERGFQVGFGLGITAMAAIVSSLWM